MENASKALIIAGAILISILLITIGIVLINSGRNVTTQGTAQMASQTIQAFNSKFTQYEGTIEGSHVRDLLATARSNNATDKAHPVVVNAGAATLTEATINNTKKYKVTLHYSTGTATTATNALVGTSPVTSEEGYIDLITVSE